MQFEQGQLAAIAASDSSDRSKDKTDQKVISRLPVMCLFVHIHFC